MYTPKHFREDDLVVLQTLMRDYSFATLISVQDDSLPIASHLPFVYDPEPAPYGMLKAHMALGNPQWKTFQEGREVLVIFQGPHAYISPSWYEVELSVPTWNYATVHAYGSPRLLKGRDEFYKHLQTLIAIHESQFDQPWPFQLPEDYVEKLMKGAIGFEIPVTRLEGKFKMSQNRSENERIRVSAELRASGDPTLCEVAELVRGARRRAE
ncbi:MAG TPA: FMN-binding negative transcriptional regulator [Ktedonobacteraceae bacterium]|nr:FMN-binding negative transcriptional regulator [Ktedonobacteraceae bacterium]